MDRSDFPFGVHYRDAHLSKINQPPEIIEKMLNWVKKPNNLFYFCGNVGNGKTYFAAAYWNYLFELGKNFRCYTEHSLFSQLMKIMNEKQDPHWELERLCQAPYFILDDMGSSKSSDWKNEMMLAFVNHRTTNNLPTLITSNHTREDLNREYHPRFASRIFASKNTIVTTNGPDRREDANE